MVTIWLFNIAKPSIKGSFSMAMLNNQRVLHDRDMIGYFGRKVWNHSGGSINIYVACLLMAKIPGYNLHHKTNHAKGTVAKRTSNPYLSGNETQSFFLSLMD